LRVSTSLLSSTRLKAAVESAIVVSIYAISQTVSVEISCSSPIKK